MDLNYFDKIVLSVIAPKALKEYRTLTWGRESGHNGVDRYDVPAIGVTTLRAIGLVGFVSIISIAILAGQRRRL